MDMVVKQDHISRRHQGWQRGCPSVVVGVATTCAPKIRPNASSKSSYKATRLKARDELYWVPYCRDRLNRTFDKRVMVLQTQVEHELKFKSSAPFMAMTGVVE